MRVKAAALAALIVLVPVSASAMSVAEFIAKGEVLKAKGMGAMFSPELKSIMTELKATGTSYRTDLEAARAAGRTDLGCPPPKGKGRMTQQEFTTAFAAVPLAERATTSVKTVFYRMMKTRYPCS